MRNFTLPPELRVLFEKRGYDFNEIREIDPGIFRVKSAYGPGDFKVLNSGMIGNSRVEFIGHEEKVCKTKIIDPVTMEVVDEYII